MQFSEIFKRYFSLFRGRAASIPVFGSKEYELGLEYANDAIDEWARADAMLWPELWTTSQLEDGLTLASGTTDYDVSSMVEPPGFITLTHTGNTDHKLFVIHPWEVKDTTDLSGKAYFTGSANVGYTLHIDSSTDRTTYNGYSIDFPYTKTPTQMTGDSDVPEMSDPSFMVHHMVALRSQKNRNGFLFKAAEAKAKEKLSNMKTKALAGTYGNSARDGHTHPGWGRASTTTSIFDQR